ncbi:MAG TPA: sulfur carrier protein ThiS [Terriglobales bacterium]|nr:sulfur carrier protein ThiS [Terriglobales bacterium]
MPIRYTAWMTVIVNGEPKECPEGASLAQFIEHMQLKGDRVAVELNRQIAARSRWAEISLREGDRLEIVHFVGGGSAQK